MIAGAGDQEKPLRERIRDLKLESAVQLPGHRDDVPDLLQACDLFVFPSVQEGLGSTVIDAMLARRAIVTTIAGGIPDLVGHGTSGDRNTRGSSNLLTPLNWHTPFVSAEHPKSPLAGRSSPAAGRGSVHDAPHGRHDDPRISGGPPCATGRQLA